jgi:quinol monooxygenase YgiN
LEKRSEREEDRMLIQVVRAAIKPEQRDHWLEVIRRNATKTRAEDGCEGYQVTEDLETPNNFIILEQWADLDAVHTHFRNQFGELMAALGDVFAAPPVASVHEVASTLTLDQVLAGAGIVQ